MCVLCVYRLFYNGALLSIQIVVATVAADAVFILDDDDYGAFTIHILLKLFTLPKIKQKMGIN